MFYVNGRNKEINAYISYETEAIYAHKDTILGYDPDSIELLVNSNYEDALAQFLQNAFEEYVADYIEWNTRPAQDTAVEHKIKTLKEKKLYPLEAQRKEETEKLSTLNGIFNLSKRNDCKKIISRIEERISSVLEEIRALEAEAARGARERELEIARFRELSDEDIREKARESAVKEFQNSARWIIYSLKEQQKRKAQTSSSEKAASYGTESENPVYSSTSVPVYATETTQEGTFTGNQLEDYGKLREKILSGDVNTTELHEFERKWGYLP